MLRILRLILAVLCLLAMAFGTQVASTWNTPECPVPTSWQEWAYR